MSMTTPGFSSSSRGLRFAQTAASLLLLFCLLAPAAHTQASTAKASAPSSSGLGFAIESEMLTYRAVESNSETIACDLAAFLYKVPATFDKSHAGSKCTVKVPVLPYTIGIIVMPFDQTLTETFQTWRADMEIMNKLIRRSDAACMVVPAGSGSAASVVSAGSSAAASLAGLTPAGTMIGMAQGVLGSFAQQTEINAVSGTVQDQAFMNAVARQLNVLGFAILQPSSYAPSSFTGVEETKSPFLQRFATLLDRRDCVAHKATDDKTLAGLQDEMNALFSSLTGGSSTTQKASTTTGGATSGSGGGNSGAAQSQTQSSTRAVQLSDVLYIDGLASKLGIGQDGRQTPGQWQHILLLKALESGGTVTKTTNILGTHVRYNGGAVGTFTMFNLDGTVECSGNVFDFGGSVPAKHFERDLQHYSPDMSAQLLFQRGGCMVAGPH